MVTLFGRESAWTAIATITPSAIVAPTSPTGPAVTGGVGEATLQWRNPASSNFGFVRVWRATSSSFGSASAIADVPGGLSQIVTFTDDDGGTLAAGTYWWWFASYDVPGVLASATVGPVTATVT